MSDFEEKYKKYLKKYTDLKNSVNENNQKGGNDHDFNILQKAKRPLTDENRIEIVEKYQKGPQELSTLLTYLHMRVHNLELENKQLYLIIQKMLDR